jgi:hypothetical protein
MRAAILYCFAIIAMSLAFVMPAQAVVGGGSSNAIDADILTSEVVGLAQAQGGDRQSVPQLEAAVTPLAKVTDSITDDDEGLFYHAQVAISAGAKPEVGWRRSPTAA